MPPTYMLCLPSMPLLRRLVAARTGRCPDLALALNVQEKYAAALVAAPAAATSQRAVYLSNRAAAMLKLEQWAEAVQVRRRGAAGRRRCSLGSAAGGYLGLHSHGRASVPSPGSSGDLMAPGHQAISVQGGLTPEPGRHAAARPALTRGKEPPVATVLPAGVQRSAGPAARLHQGAAAPQLCLRKAG